VHPSSVVSLAIAGTDFDSDGAQLPTLAGPDGASTRTGPNIPGVPGIDPQSPGARSICRLGSEAQPVSVEAYRCTVTEPQLEPTGSEQLQSHTAGSASMPVNAVSACVG
jgi:hypothetical protein